MVNNQINKVRNEKIDWSEFEEWMQWVENTFTTNTAMQEYKSDNKTEFQKRDEDYGYMLGQIASQTDKIDDTFKRYRLMLDKLEK